MRGTVWRSGREGEQRVLKNYVSSHFITCSGNYCSCSHFTLDSS
jgi:hypothetical protein